MNDFQRKQFGKYYLLDKLAVGGMAEIYKAKTFGAEGFEKQLCIKRILPHCSADKEFITMLVDEAKLSVLLSHANIVQVYDLGKVGEDYFIAMEYIHGVNLRDVIFRCRELSKKIPPDIAVYIVSEMCKGLDYAHRKVDNNNQPLDIVHRDISPQNILISFEGEVKIVDFGIAKAAMNISHTMAGILKGKIAYMSPEQAMGKSVDRRTDIFSAGIILYEMLTGQKAFTGDSQFEVLKKIRTVHFEAGNFPNSIPEKLKPILAKALAYRVEDRYQNAGDFQIELTKFLYASYLDFSPRKLAAFIADLFRNELAAERKTREKETTGRTSTSTVNVEEIARQVDIVHAATGVSAEAEEESTTRRMRKAPVGGRRTPTTPPPTQRQKKLGLWIGLGAVVIVLAAGTWLFRENMTPAPKEEIPAPIAPPPQTPPSTAVPAELTKEGLINIISDPPGAAILLNGRATGLSTPATLERIPLGVDQRITLTKPNYEDFDQVITLTDTAPQRISTVLKPVAPTPLAQPEPTTLPPISTPTPAPEPTPTPAPQTPTPEPTAAAETPAPTEQVKLSTLQVTSTPSGATVFMDGARQGTTPMSIRNLEVGKTHSFRFELDDYKTATSRKTIKRDKESLSVTLQPALPTPAPAAPVPQAPAPAPAQIPQEAPQASPSKGLPAYGEISINTTPARARVSFDGQEIPARTPVTIRRVKTNVPHQLVITLDGFQTVSRTIRMTKEREDINIQLQRQ